MSQVVQAKCPHCQNVLRVPAEWLGKTMRCKYCQNTFAAAGKVSAAALPAKPVNGDPAKAKAAVPVAKGTNGTPAPAAPRRPAGDPFAFDDDDAPAPPPMPAARKRGGPGKAILLVGCLVVALPVLAVGTVAGLYFSGVLTSLLPVPREREEDPIAKGEDKKEGKGKPVGLPGGKDVMPRRALLINVNNYLYLNSVHYGSPQAATYPGSSTGALADQLQRPPMKVHPTQVYELSDGANRSHPTELSVIKAAITDFLESSRTQDRIVLLFAGHATEIVTEEGEGDKKKVTKEAYLIPIAGEPDKAETMIPLSWVYDQLRSCKARQKLLILDVFRFPPALGFELPGAGASDEGEMGDAFAELLDNPPDGVQVWCSCGKGQRSIEFDAGSVFMQSFLHTLRTGPALTGFVSGDDPLPIDEAFVDKVNKRMKETIGAQKFEQVSKLTGKAEGAGSPFNPAESLPPVLALKQPTPPGGKAAGPAVVDNILKELRLLPPVRQTRAGEERLLQAANLPAFPAGTLDSYKADGYKHVEELRKEYEKDRKGFAEKYPIRAAVFDAITALERSQKIVMREELAGPINPKTKASFLAEQREPGLAIFELEQALGQMRTAADEMEKETSRRWRANFDYTMARVKSRLVYIYEYSFLLGQIRLDSLPTLEENQNGWRVGSRKKIQVTEQKAKQYAKEVRSSFEKIQEEHPNTPWAVLSRRESLVALGLEWRAKSN